MTASNPIALNAQATPPVALQANAVRKPTATAQSLAGDERQLAALRGKAGSDPKAAIAQAAKQFEALFMRELLKSMRQSLPTSGMLDNSATRMGTEMYDAQLAEQMAGAPGSLASMIARQLERHMQPAVPPAAPLAGDEASVKTSRTLQQFNRPQPSAASLGEATTPTRIPDQRAAGFLTQHARAAEAAQASSGIPATFMLAQAAHESGWGRREITHADGSSAHNLFGIKATGNWKGAVAEVVTTEYVQGEPRKGVQRFRAYESYEASFADYAQLIQSSPRYQAAYERALAATQKQSTAALASSRRAGQAPATQDVSDEARGFAQGLQKAGYATDPQYAAKLERVINTTMRMQRAKQG